MEKPAEMAKKAAEETLRSKLAPHILQDLGLNPYPSLQQVLVEFVPNASAADSPIARFTVGHEEIDKHGKTILKMIDALADRKAK